MKNKEDSSTTTTTGTAKYGNYIGNSGLTHSNIQTKNSIVKISATQNKRASTHKTSNNTIQQFYDTANQKANLHSTLASEQLKNGTQKLKSSFLEPQ